MHATDPVEITLLDGRTAALRLTMGGLRRLLARYNARSIQALWTEHGEMAVIGVLYEALPPEMRASMSEDEFAELLPASLDDIAAVVARLFGAGGKSPFAPPTTQ